MFYLLKFIFLRNAYGYSALMSYKTENMGLLGDLYMV